MTPDAEPEGAPGLPGGALRQPPGPARYRAVLDNLHEIVFQTDARGNWTYLNRAWTEVTGFPVQPTLGTNFLDYVHPEERETTLALFAAVVRGAAGHCHHEARYRRADGGSIWVELRATVLFDEQGHVTGNVGTILDISARRRAQGQLAEQARVLELIACDKPLAESLGALASLLARDLGSSVAISVLPAPPPAPADALLVTDRADGVPLPEAEGGRGSLGVPVHDSTGARLGTILVGPAEGGGVALDEDGRLLVERCGQLAAIAIDRRRAGETARHQALHDPLTGLPNRILYQDRLQQALAAARRSGRRVALLLLDLDHFKMVNDTLGHEAGDRVLRDVARRLSGTLRSSDTVCRLGGDEFVVVLPDLEPGDDAERMARKVHSALSRHFDVNGVKLHLEFSLGVALSDPAEPVDPAALLRQADVAMYRAKRAGGGPARYDPHADQERLRGLNLAGELLQALDDGQFVVHYQPKIDLRAGAVSGVEALVRWRHPTLGLVAPDLFVPLAETTAAIKPLSLWVLHTALADRRRWREQGMDVGIAVNLSARVLHDAELPDLVGEALRQQGASARGLELEITESALMADPERAIRAMGRLIDAGVGITIDDFGTGYSSLTYLKRLPARSLKIDKSFVQHMDADERDASIVRSAIELGHSLGMVVVAEGVETRPVLRLLGSLRCDYAQGFHVARPMPATQLPTWLRARPRTPAG